MKDQDLIKFQQFEEDFKNADSLKAKFLIFKKNEFFLTSYDLNMNFLYIDILIQLAISEKDYRSEHVYYLFKFNYYRFQGKYDKALLLVLKSRSYFLSVKEYKTYYKVLSDIAVVMYELSINHQAVYLFKEVYINSKELNDLSLKNLALINLSYTSLENYQTFKNLELHLNEIIAYYEQNEMYNNILYCKANALLGYYYLHSKKQYEEALMYSQKAYSIAIELKDLVAQFQICIVLSECYEAQNDTKNKIAYLLKAKNVIADNPKFIKAIPIYNTLYEHYKSIDDYKNALKYYQLKHNLELIKFDQEIEVKNILKQIGFYFDEKSHHIVQGEYTKKHIFDFNRDLFLENIKGDLIKVNIESIVYITANNKMIKIHFVDKSNFVFKLNLKEIWEIITDKFGKDHLFFQTNLRSEIVNLFWMSKYDKLNKKLYINVLGEETSFELTRGQSLLLKDFLDI